MIFGVYVLALTLIVQLPAQLQLLFGALLLATFPRVLRWVRSGR